MIVLSILLYFHSLLRAQVMADNYWQNGKVYLTSGDTLRGNFKFNLTNEVLQIEVRGTIKTFSARKILAFDFFDRIEQKKRYYYTLPYSKVSHYKTPSFFELLFQENPLTLLCREKLITQTVVYNNPYNTYPSNTPIIQTRIKYEFYILKENGEIVPFNGTKKHLLYLLRDREKDIKTFLKENRISYTNKRDMIRVIDFYNFQKNKNKQ